MNDDLESMLRDIEHQQVKPKVPRRPWHSYLPKINAIVPQQGSSKRYFGLFYGALAGSALLVSAAIRPEIATSSWDALASAAGQLGERGQENPLESPTQTTQSITAFRPFSYDRATIDAGLAKHPEGKAYLADGLESVFQTSFFMQGHEFLTFKDWIVSDVQGTLAQLLDGKAAQMTLSNGLTSNPELVAIGSHKNQKNDYVLELKYTYGQGTITAYFAMRTPEKLIALDNYLANLQSTGYTPQSDARWVSILSPINADEQSIKTAWSCFSTQLGYDLYVLMENQTQSGLYFDNPSIAETQSMMQRLTDGIVGASSTPYNPRDTNLNPELVNIKTSITNDAKSKYEIELWLKSSSADGSSSTQKAIITTDNFYVTYWISDILAHPVCT